jgi:threonine/homoserine/homoserine lactone efflux protein
VTALLAGFGAGFMVSMQLGPLSLFLIRSTLRGTLAIGLAIGAGIAIVDALYATAGAAGAASALSIDSCAHHLRAGRSGRSDRARGTHPVERVPRASGRGE